MRRGEPGSTWCASPSAPSPNAVIRWPDAAWAGAKLCSDPGSKATRWGAVAEPSPSGGSNSGTPEAAASGAASCRRSRGGMPVRFRPPPNRERSAMAGRRAARAERAAHRGPAETAAVRRSVPQPFPLSLDPSSRAAVRTAQSATATAARQRASALGRAAQPWQERHSSSRALDTSRPARGAHRENRVLGPTVGPGQFVDHVEQTPRGVTDLGPQEAGNVEMH